VKDWFGYPQLTRKPTLFESIGHLMLRTQERTHAPQQTACTRRCFLLDHLVVTARQPPFAGRNVMECRAGDHSALMPADLITLAHFSVSSAMNLPNSAGDAGATEEPRSSIRDLI
jgi:hypothetical protein